MNNSLFKKETNILNISFLKITTRIALRVETRTALLLPVLKDISGFRLNKEKRETDALNQDSQSYEENREAGGRGTHGECGQLELLSLDL